MKRPDAILSEVVRLVAARCGIPTEQVGPETRLLHDLQIDGDDAAELIETFCGQFDMSSEGFNFSLYFNSEVTVERFVSILTRDRSRLLERDELRVKDLVVAAQEKRFGARCD